jgi:hypothetical protein
MTVPYLQLFAPSYAGTVHVSLALVSSFHILCYEERIQFSIYDKGSGIHHPLDGKTGVQQYKSRAYQMIEKSKTGVIRTNSKHLQNNIQHVYEYTTIFET